MNKYNPTEIVGWPGGLQTIGQTSRTIAMKVDMIQEVKQ